jgi:hypothetical protein
MAENENQAIEEKLLEGTGCECGCEHYPEFYAEPDEDAVKEGAKVASSMLGFLGALNMFDLSEKNIMDILRIKMTLDYEERITKATLEAQIRIAEIDNVKEKKNII